MSNPIDNHPKIPAALFRCFAQAGGHIVHQKYQSALSALLNGLNETYEASEIDGCDLLENMRMLVGVLDYNLRQAYGVDWENHVAVPSIPDKASRCSFCSKTYAEVSKLITGTDGNICNECIGICNELITEGEPSS